MASCIKPDRVRGFLINLSVLGIAIILEFFVLYKAGKEILHEVGIDKGGMAPITTSFTHLKRAKPATKLVFMEDLVATAGGILAFTAVLTSTFLGITDCRRYCFYYYWFNDVLRSW